MCYVSTQTITLLVTSGNSGIVIIAFGILTVSQSVYRLHISMPFLFSENNESLFVDVELEFFW